MTARLALWIAAIAGSGCVLGPQEEPPMLPAPDEERTHDDEGDGAGSVAEVDAGSDEDSDDDPDQDGDGWVEPSDRRLDVNGAIELAPNLLVPRSADPRQKTDGLPVSDLPSGDDPDAGAEGGDEQDDDSDQLDAT